MKFAVRFSGPNGYKQTVNYFHTRELAEKVVAAIIKEHADWKVWIDVVAWNSEQGKYVIANEGSN